MGADRYMGKGGRRVCFPLLIALTEACTGLSKVLEAGYHLIFFDADVFFRWDVFEYMKGLDDASWDMQIQEESHRNFVNTGASLFSLRRAARPTSSRVHLHARHREERQDVG